MQVKIIGLEWLDEKIKTGVYANQTWRERFNAQVFASHLITCWLWKGKCYPNGYGVMYGPNGKEFLAHRVQWAIHNGRLPTSEEVVRHKCNNRQCVNPDHLLIGSHADNVKDMIRNGRSVAVMNHFAAIEIRDLYASGEWTQAMLAEKFGVSQQLVSLIVRGEKWAVKTLNEYQAAAVMTLQPTAELQYTTSKIMIEAAESAQIIYKHVYHGAPIDLEKLIEELGDTLYYIAATAHLMGWNLDEIATLNIAKLRKRHGTQYSSQHYQT